MSVRLPPFQTLVDAYHRDVYRFLVAAAGAEEADDCFQETFLSALAAYPALRNGSNLRAWLFTIAHRKAMDAHRRRRRRPQPVEAVPDRRVDPPDGDPALWRQVRALPAGERAAVLHRFVGDLPYRDIAGILGCSEEAARRRVHEGVRKLREVWRP